MSTIPSFITNLTTWMYGASYEATSLVEQFRTVIGLSPDQPIPDTPTTEQAYIEFLSKRVPILQFIATLTSQLFGSSASVDAAVSDFRNFLNLAPSDPLPDTDAAEEMFADRITQTNATTLYLGTIAQSLYGTTRSLTSLLDGYRASMGLLADQAIPDSSSTQLSFLSYITELSPTALFINTFTHAMTGSSVTDSELTGFRAYLGLQPDEAIPDNYDTRMAYVQYFGQISSFAPYAASAVMSAFGSSIVENEAILDEFRASLGLAEGQAISSDSATKHAFLYFLASPTATAAQGFYGISADAASSIAAFRATLIPHLAAGTPIPTDDATLQKYLTYLHGAGGGPATLAIEKFMADSLASFNGSSLTNDVISQFRSYLGLKNSAAIPNDDDSKAAFMDFLQGKLATVGKSAAVNALSPQEEEVRRILFSAFSMVITMLNTLQQTTRLETQALQLYADWEKEYTNQMASTPIYGPNIPNQITVQSGDFGATTLGYGNVTVRQVARWLLQQIQTTGEDTATFSIVNPSISNSTVDGNATAAFPRFELKKNQITGEYTFSIQSPPYVTTTTDADGNTMYDDQGNVITQVTPAIDVNGTWNTLLSATATPSQILEGVPQSDDMIDKMMTQLGDKWNTNSFDSDSFNICTFLYTRDNDGNLNYSDYVAQTLPTTDLKLYWTGQPNASTFVYTQNRFGGHAYHGAYYDWTNGLIDTTLSHHASIQDAVNYSIEKMYQQKVTTFYYDCGNIRDGIVSHKNKQFLLKIVLTSSTPTENTYDLYWARASDGTFTETTSVDHDWNHVTTFTAPVLNAYIGSGLWGPWQSPGAGAWPETYPYPSNYPKESLQNVRSQSNTYVGEINAQLQQYIQTTQARKANLDNSMKVMQNLIAQTTQATTNQANLLDAIMQSLKSLLTSIFH